MVTVKQAEFHLNPLCASVVPVKWTSFPSLTGMLQRSTCQNLWYAQPKPMLVKAGPESITYNRERGWVWNLAWDTKAVLSIYSSCPLLHQCQPCQDERIAGTENESYVLPAQDGTQLRNNTAWLQKLQLCFQDRQFKSSLCSLKAELLIQNSLGHNEQGTQWQHFYSCSPYNGSL